MTDREDKILIKSYIELKDISKTAKHLNRHISEVRIRLRHLNLITMREMVEDELKEIQEIHQLKTTIHGYVNKMTKDELIGLVNILK